MTYTNIYKEPPNLHAVSQAFYRVFLLMHYLGVYTDRSNCARSYGEEALVWLEARHHIITQGYGYMSKRQ